MRGAATALLLAALVSGCAAPQVAGLLERPPPDLPASVEIATTPFYAQEDYQCGPASLAALLNHAGRDATPTALAPQVFLPARQGSLQAELLAATRRHGLLALGATVPDAFMHMYFFEQPCKIQIDALAAGRDRITLVPDAAIERTRAQVNRPRPDRRDWPALLRMLDRRQADFRS